MEKKIREKLKELATQKEQLIAQLNAVIGSEQTLNALLEVKDNENSKN